MPKKSAIAQHVDDETANRGEIQSFRKGALIKSKNQKRRERKPPVAGHDGS